MLTNKLASLKITINILYAALTKSKELEAALAQETLDGGRGGSNKKCILMPEKLHGTRSKVRAFII